MILFLLCARGVFMRSCFFPSYAGLLWEKEVVHCSREEVELTRIQEMFRPASVCVIGPGCGTPSLRIGGKGPGTENKTQWKAWLQFRPLWFLRPFFPVLLWNTPPHTCPYKWVFLFLMFCRGDSQGPCEWFQHTSAAGRSQRPALRQPHSSHRRNLILWRRHLPALPLPPWHAIGRHRHQTGICAELCALDPFQTAW